MGDCAVTLQVCGCEAWKKKFLSSASATRHTHTGQSLQLWYILNSLHLNNISVAIEVVQQWLKLKDFFLYFCVWMGEEWATDEVLFYSTLEGLRCSKVFRLDLTPSEGRITSVYEETQPK